MKNKPPERDGQKLAGRFAKRPEFAYVARTSIDAYRKNLQRIVTYLKQLAPHAKLIFATTTPVPENTFNPTRIAGDSER